MSVSLGYNVFGDQLATTYGIAREIEGSRSYSESDGEPSATRILICRWYDRDEIVKALLGSWNSGEIVLYPDSYPGYPQLECSRISYEGYGLIGTGEELEEGDEYYKYAKITAEYTMGKSLTWQNVWSAEITGTIEALVIDVSQSIQQFAWDSDGDPIPYGINRTCDTAGITITKNLATSSECTEALSLRGSVNTLPVTIGFKGCGEETLLVEEVSIKPSPYAIDYYQITVNCKYRDNGWNYLYRYSTEQWEKVTPDIYTDASFSIFDKVYINLGSSSEN